MSDESVVVTTPKSLYTIETLWRVQKIILDTLDFNQVVERIVDGLLVELGYLQLGYRIIVLTLIDEEKGVLKRISLSQTEEADKALKASAVQFHDIDIPLSANNNLLIKSITEKKIYTTDFWPDIFLPVLTTEQALKNQQAAGIKTSKIYPIVIKEKAIGALIFSMVKSADEISKEEEELILGFTDIVGLAVQNSKLYSALQTTTDNLKIANDKLKELDQRKDEFISLTSHELHTPLAAIRSYLWMAETGRGGPLTEKQQYYLERAYNSTIRLIKLVNDMLNVSRIESGRLLFNMEKLSLPKLIGDTLDEVRPKAEELGINLVTDFSGSEGAEILGDPDKLKEVIINLIGNSLKFTPSGGEIKISLAGKEGNIITSVKDTGQGLSAEDLPKLFQKFGLIAGSYITNQKAAQGTGLGLYISKSIIEAHKGNMWAESDGVGKGATFNFSLPYFSQTELDRYRKENAGREGLGIIHSTID